MDRKDDTGAFKVPLTNAGAQQQTDAMLKSEPSSNSGLDVGHNIDITMPSTSNPCITHETTGQQQGKRKLDSAEDNCIHPPSGKKLKALKPDELPQALMPTPEQNAESIPVQQPVDPKTLQIPERSVYTCNECKQRVEKRYHCTVCEDYDLCSNCYQKISHNHKMEKLDLEPDVDSDSSSDASCNPQEARRLSIQRCIQSLVHACQCRDANCQLPSCQKMKRLVQHTKVCKRKTNGECPICKQLIALCCYHAKHCQEQICLVPFCLNIKHKLRQRQLQQVQLLRQCMEHAGA